MNEPAVHSERRDGVAVIVIDNAPVNALAQPVRAALLAELGRCGGTFEAWRAAARR